MTKHIGTDRNNLANPKTEQVSPKDLRPLPPAAGKQWDSAGVFYECKAAADSTRSISLKNKPYFTTESRHAAQRMAFENTYSSLALAEKFLPLELRSH